MRKRREDRKRTKRKKKKTRKQENKKCSSTKRKIETTDVKILNGKNVHEREGQKKNQPLLPLEGLFWVSERLREETQYGGVWQNKGTF